MSDIRFNRWLHQSGTGGVYQDSSGRVGIGTSVPTSALDVQSGTIKIGSNTLSSTGVSTFTTVNANSVNATRIVGVVTAGITTAYVTSINDGPLSGFRNRIINGDCRIDQRQAGAASTTQDGYPVDRWKIEYNGNGVLTGIQTTDVPTGQGFTNAIRITSTARSTLSSDNFYQIYYAIEGFNVSDFDFGTSAAKTITLSFWVKGSRTGTYNAQLGNSSGSRAYTKQYTISSANTWQKVILTYPGCPDGTWLKTNGVGLSLRFGFEYGTVYDGGTADTWISTTGFADSFPTMTNTFMTNSNSTWFITGVQLEVGDRATEFERRSYGQELSLCHRYYRRYNSTGTTYTAFGVGVTANSSSISRWGFNLDIPMRTTPVPAFTNCIGWNGALGGAVSLNLNFSSTNFIDADLTTSGLTNTTGLIVKVLMLSNGFIELTGCEL